MTAARKLKVFRTSTGFHDAYVAAPSRKAALEAWGASKDLFAIGSAEIVTDPALTKEPLEHPGKVMKRSRGGLYEQLAALPKSEAARAPEEPEISKPRGAKPKPRPTRARLDEAEAAVRTFAEQAEAELAALRKREEEIRCEREALERRNEATGGNLEAKLARARDQYERALARWREDL